MSVTDSSHAVGPRGECSLGKAPGALPPLLRPSVCPQPETAYPADPFIAGSDEHFHLLVDAVTDYAIYMLDAQGRVMTWNAGAERSKGYKAEEVLGRSFSLFFLPEDAAAGLPEQELREAARVGRSAAEGWRLRKSGEKFWAQVTLTAIRGAEGRLCGFAKVTRDMTAQKTAQETIHNRNEQLERYRIIVQNVTEYVIFSMDPEGRITSWAAGAERESGFSEQQMLGRPFSIFFPPEEVEAGVPAQELAEAARCGKYAVDAWRQTPDGKRLWSSSVLSAVRDPEGNLTGFVRVARVMTRQKEDEDALRQLNAQLERYRIIVENVDEYSIYTLDAEGRVSSWEAGAQKLSGVPAEQMLGRHYSTFFTPDEIAAGVPEHELAEAARTGRFSSDSWRTTPKGKRVWSSGVLSALRDENGVLTGYMRIAHMLTAQKKAEESLRAVNAQLDRYRVIVENITNHVIFTLDPEGRFDSWSSGAQNVLGYTGDEVLGRDYAILFAADEAESGGPRRELDEAARAGHCTTEGWRLRSNRELFWCIGETTALRDAAGRVAGFVRVARDMTRQKRAEESLARLAAELEERVAERTRQLEATVDELRGKNEQVEALARLTTLDLEEKRLMLNEIHHRVKNNLQVVQSLLKMSVRSLPAGEARSVTMTTAQRVFAMAMVHEHLYQTKDLAGIAVSKYLRDLISGVADSNAALHGQVQVELDCDEILLNLDHAIPFGLLVNELLANCLKHGYPDGRKGTVAISVRRLPDAVDLVFQDDGVGLPDGFDAARCTSMGLKLAASLSHQLGGKLHFSSARGCRVQAMLARL